MPRESLWVRIPSSALARPESARHVNGAATTMAVNAHRENSPVGQPRINLIFCKEERKSVRIWNKVLCERKVF